VLVVVLVVVVELLASPLDEDSTTRSTTTTTIPGCIQEAPDSGADAPPGRVARAGARLWQTLADTEPDGRESPNGD